MMKDEAAQVDLMGRGSAGGGGGGGGGMRIENVVIVSAYAKWVVG